MDSPRLREATREITRLHGKALLASQKCTFFNRSLQACSQQLAELKPVSVPIRLLINKIHFRLDRVMEKQIEAVQVLCQINRSIEQNVLAFVDYLDDDSCSEIIGASLSQSAEVAETVKKASSFG